MADSATVEIRRVVRSTVSADFQRKVIPLCGIVLAFGVFQLVASVFKFGPVGGGIAAGLQLFLYYARVDRENPRSAVLFSKFAEYLSKGIVGSLIPALVSIAVFAAASGNFGFALLLPLYLAWLFLRKGKLGKDVDQEGDTQTGGAS